ncbi:protein lethal(2)denticleless [Lepeophtheirus salmonis]|uniref:protein lethal(2)denticleless n=1 Tax=Lepeophtheirus salmonis TaxID=72036 RepID=UPI001AE94779|nr:protein lethal(2)denticleless-like [Lepeophtheirus salmonis]
MYHGNKKHLLDHLNGFSHQLDAIRDNLEVLTLRSYRQNSICLEAEEDPSEPTYTLRFYPREGEKESLLAIGKEEGQVRLEDVNTNKTLFNIRAHTNAIFDLDWSPSGDVICTGSGDETLGLWDSSNFKSIQFLRGGHERTVKTLQFAPGSDKVIASGSRDNSIILWDVRSPVPMLNRIKNAHVSKAHRSCSVTSIKFLQKDNCLVSVGEMDGLIKVWDLRKNYSLYKRDPIPSYSLPHPGGSSSLGFTCLAVDSSNTVFVSCMDDKIYRYNLASNSDLPVNTYTGYENNSFFVRISLSPDEEYLASGSSDSFSYIWRVNSLAYGQETYPICKLQGHLAEVTCVEWCKGNWTLVTCSDDVQHCIWRPDRRDIENPSDVFGETVPYKQPIPLTPPSRYTSLIPNTTQTPPIHFTPSSLNKRNRSDRTPGNSTSKKRKLTPSILNFFPKSGSKRSLSDNESCASTPPCKKSNIENVSPQKESLKTLVTIQEREPLMHKSRNKNVKKLFDEVTEQSSTSSSPFKFDRYPCSPTKMLILSNKDLESPKRLHISPMKPFSPTLNLPNSVIDRQTPTSSSKKRDRPINWLTSLTNKKKSKAAKKL